jgi:hypothetical protein
MPRDRAFRPVQAVAPRPRRHESFAAGPLRALSLALIVTTASRKCKQYFPLGLQHRDNLGSPIYAGLFSSWLLT